MDGALPDRVDVHLPLAPAARRVLGLAVHAHRRRRVRRAEREAALERRVRGDRDGLVGRARGRVQARVEWGVDEGERGGRIRGVRDDDEAAAFEVVGLGVEAEGAVDGSVGGGALVKGSGDAGRDSPVAGVDAGRGGLVVVAGVEEVHACGDLCVGGA